MGLLTDPFIAGRGDRVSCWRHECVCRGAGLAYAAQRQAALQSERDAYAAIYRKAPVEADPSRSAGAFGRRAYGGSQTTDGNAAFGSNNTTSRIYGGAVGADYRFSPYTLAGFALAGGGTIQRCQRSWHRPLRPVPGRRLHAAHVGPSLSVRRAGLWLAGHHHRSHRHLAGIDQLRAKFNANAFSGPRRRRLSFCQPVDGWALRPMPRVSSPPSICRPMPSRRWSAPTPLRSPTVQRRHGLAHRTGLAQRQIVRDAGWYLHLARSRGMGT